MPLGILAAFIIMSWQGITANIMSLGGIAIAIGAMVDASIVMVENAHRKLSALSKNASATDKASLTGLLKPSAGESLRPKLSAAEVEKLIAADSAKLITIALGCPEPKIKFLLSASKNTLAAFKDTKLKS